MYKCTRTMRLFSPTFLLLSSKELTSPLHELTPLYSIVEQAGTNLPGIPHTNRVCRLYRQWLKLAILCPPSGLCEFNGHVQMNERFVIVLRQKFSEGAELRDPNQIAVAVQTCERNLAMFRLLAADVAKRKYPEAKPRLNLHKTGFLEMAKINYKQMVKEYWNMYIRRKW